MVSCGTRTFVYDDGTILQEIKESVYTLSADDMLGRETGTEGEILAAKYIMGEYVQIGIQAFPSIGGYLQPFLFSANPHFDPNHGHPTGQSIGHNIVGYLDNNSDEWIVLGAHYDHLGMGGPYSRAPEEHAIHNGADDNASGVACLLSIARRLKGMKLNENILFVAFSGEEFGLWGSKHFTDDLPIAQSSIKYMLNFDMVGRMSPERELVAYGTGTTSHWPTLLEEANDDLNLTIIEHESGSGPSDHAAFYNKDIPVLFFFTGQHEDYHKPSDDAEKINLMGIHMTSKLATNLIQEADNIDEMTFIKTKDPETKKMDFKVTLGVIPDYVYQGKGMRIDGVKSDRPASNAGLQKGDVIVKIGDFEVADIYKYMEVLGQFNQGDQTTITVLRGDDQIEMPLTW